MYCIVKHGNEKRPEADYVWKGEDVLDNMEGRRLLEDIFPNKQVEEEEMRRRLARKTKKKEQARGERWTR